NTTRHLRKDNACEVKARLKTLVRIEIHSTEKIKPIEIT
ncbi:MAG: hypothetical protein ACI8RH_001562, partial [Flavobacteriales bacterium]